jgi:hypothetical protein
VSRSEIVSVWLRYNETDVDVFVNEQLLDSGKGWPMFF